VTPEFYYYRFLPENGFGLSLHGENDAIVVRNGDTGCFPNGILHSQTTAPGYAEWYLWVIRLREDEPMETVEVGEHAWAGKPDAKYFPDI
jgi:5-deoxy-glucuronate isomerase